MIAHQAQKAAIVPGALTLRIGRRRATLLASTALTSAILAGSMLAPESAFAASCTTNTGASPDTITCPSGNTTGMLAPLVSTDPNGVNTTISSGAVVTGNGLNLFAPISVGLTGPTFNFTMNNPSSITSTQTGLGADAVDVTGVNAVSGTWSIGGTIESSAGTGINIVLPSGTGTSGIGMTITGGGIVRADNGTAISFGGVSGVNNDTVTNNGQIYAVGGSSHNGIFMTFRHGQRNADCDQQRRR